MVCVVYGVYGVWGVFVVGCGGVCGVWWGVVVDVVVWCVCGGVVRGGVVCVCHDGAKK